MPKRKRSKAKGFTNSLNVRISGAKVTEAQKAVKNFNARLKRALKYTDPILHGMLPSNVSAKEMLEKVRSNTELDFAINWLKSYRGEDFLPSPETFGAEPVTQGEYNKIVEAINQENERRARLREQVQEHEEATGRFKDSKYDELAPIDIEKIHSLEEARKKMYVISPGYVDTLAVKWKERYREKIVDTMNLLRAADPELREQYQNLVNGILQFVDQLGTEEAITAVSHMPELELYSMYRDVFIGNLRDITIGIRRMGFNIDDFIGTKNPSEQEEMFRAFVSAGE